MYKLNEKINDKTSGRKYTQFQKFEITCKEEKTWTTFFSLNNNLCTAVHFVQELSLFSFHSIVILLEVNKKNSVLKRENDLLFHCFSIIFFYFGAIKLQLVYRTPTGTIRIWCESVWIHLDLRKQVFLCL